MIRGKTSGSLQLAGIAILVTIALGMASPVRAGLFDFVMKTPYRRDIPDAYFGARRGGYNDFIAKDGRSAEVVFRGLRRDKFDRLKDFAYLRVADIALDEHYAGFHVVSSRGDDQSVVTHVTTNYVDEYGITQYQDQHNEVSPDLRWDLEAVFTNKPGPRDYSAAGIDRTVRDRYHLKNSQR